LNPTKNLVDLYDFDFGKWLMIFENNVSCVKTENKPTTMIKTTKSWACFGHKMYKICFLAKFSIINSRILQSYEKESLYKYCMNVDDGRIMQSWRSCLFFWFMFTAEYSSEYQCHYGAWYIKICFLAKFSIINSRILLYFQWKQRYMLKQFWCM
jgi:hypothetical protein